MSLLHRSHNGYYKGVSGNCVVCKNKLPVESVYVFIFLIVVLGLIMGLLWSLHHKNIAALVSVFKILFVAFQIMTSVPANFNTIFPIDFTSVLKWMSFAVFDFSLSMGAECFMDEANYYLRVQITTLVPLAVIYSCLVLDRVAAMCTPNQRYV